MTAAATIGPAAIAELGALSADGRLTPSRVLERAANPESALHQHFEWNDSAAARRYRMDQAARLIMRVRVRVVPHKDEPRLIRAVIEPQAPPGPSAPRLVRDEDDLDFEEIGNAVFFADKPPRIQPSSSYRERLDPVQGMALLQEALAELDRVRRRFAHLSGLGLGPLFDAIDELVRKAASAERPQRTTAVNLARALMEREGLDRQAAAERAAHVSGIPYAEILEALRARRAG